MLDRLQRDIQEIFRRPPRVMVAEEDEYARGVIVDSLQLVGCEPQVVTDGEKAWQQIGKMQPDLVIAGIHLSRLDGLQLCRRIKETQGLFLPVILTTPIETEEERLRAIAAGADEVLIKPFRPLLLLTRLRSLLHLKRLHDLLEERRRLLQEVLNLYLNPDLAKLILEDPEHHLRLGGESQRITVLFADLRGFTAFADRFPPTRVVDTLNTIFKALTEEIVRYQGLVDKFVGDEVIALFGAPFPNEEAPRRALQAAWAMQQRFRALREKAAGKGPLWAIRGLGIGVHTGEAVVGNIGSPTNWDYTAVGATVNLGNHLQRMARPGEILLSQETLNAVPDAQVSFVAEMYLPGGREKMTIYRLEAPPKGGNPQNL